MKRELRDVLDAASQRVRERPDYLMSPEVRKELDQLAEERMEQQRVKERPILFSSQMIRAILDGRKGQTRRVVKPREGFTPFQIKGGAFYYIHNGELGEPEPFGDPIKDRLPCPYGQPGDRLWVREKQRIIGVGPVTRRAETIRVRYEADGAESGLLPYPARLGKPQVGKCLAYGGYRESSRLTLDVLSVRVERLQSLTLDDARAEGIPQTAGEAHQLGLIDLAKTPGHEWDNRTSVENFAHLWDRINGKRASWASSPFVWVIGFRRAKEAARAA